MTTAVWRSALPTPTPTAPLGVSEESEPVVTPTMHIVLTIKQDITSQHDLHAKSYII
eukprot:m.62063 g.62063  ORF g.62063 m.62063 type:complete len:57 (+) comp17643_c1_seq1:206-376(+)